MTEPEHPQPESATSPAETCIGADPTPEELAAWAELAEKATADWTADFTEYYEGGQWVSYLLGPHYPCADPKYPKAWAVFEAQRKTDMAFLLAARAGWPRTITALERGRERITQLETALKLALRHNQPGDYLFACIDAQNTNLRQWGRKMHRRAQKAEGENQRLTWELNLERLMHDKHHGIGTDEGEGCLRDEVERLRALNEDKFRHMEAYCRAATEDKAEISRLTARVAEYAEMLSAVEAGMKALAAIRGPEPPPSVDDDSAEIAAIEARRQERTDALDTVLWFARKWAQGEPRDSEVLQKAEAVLKKREGGEG